MNEFEFGVKLHRGSGTTPISNPVHTTGAGAWGSRSSGCKHKFSRGISVACTASLFCPDQGPRQSCHQAEWKAAERSLKATSWGPAGSTANHLRLCSLAVTQMQKRSDPSTS